VKKSLPYILGGIIVVAAAIMIFTGGSQKKRELDERLSFMRRDKIPYGTYVAYESLQYLFPAAHITTNKKAPIFWDSLSEYQTGQALIIISPTFYADEFEMKKIIRFIEKGNDVFVSAAFISQDVKRMLGCDIGYVDMYDLLPNIGTRSEDTLKVRLEKPTFNNHHTYKYPGRRLDSYFFKLDTAVTSVLGTGRDIDTNFVHLKAGEGNLYLHLAPMSFTNYFLLRGDNMKYYSNVMSVISPLTKKIVWDEYYRFQKPGDDNSRNDRNAWLSTLFGYPALRAAILTAIFTLLLYVLLEMRRKQRPIPVIARPRNDSLDFVKTIGRLYYDKGDHKNLCRKMGSYFLEHVRNRYKMPTAELNDEFIKNLHYKTGINEGEIKAIVYFIRDMEHAPGISDHQLHYFHKQLESFYSKA